MQRLHRNLGHPTVQQLHKLLTERTANDRLLAACAEHRCHQCGQRRAPAQVPKSGLYRGAFFNDSVQADTPWLKLHTEGSHSSGKKPRAVPILVISDATARFAAARLLPDETAKSFVQALERAWDRHFGTMRTLQVDEHRSWASDTLKDWTSHMKDWPSLSGDIMSSAGLWSCSSWNPTTSLQKESSKPSTTFSLR